MNDSAAYEAMMSAIAVAWAAAGQDADALIFEDTGRKRPDGNALEGEAETWAFASFRTTSSPQETIGEGRRYQVNGTLTVQVFVPIGSGTLGAKSIGDAMKASIRARSSLVGGVWMFSPTVLEIGPDGPWFNANLEVTIRYQQNAAS
jgi:hypothetical protein